MCRDSCLGLLEALEVWCMNCRDSYLGLLEALEAWCIKVPLWMANATNGSAKDDRDAKRAEKSTCFPSQWSLDCAHHGLSFLQVLQPPL